MIRKEIYKYTLIVLISLIIIMNISGCSYIYNKNNIEEISSKDNDSAGKEQRNAEVDEKENVSDSNDEDNEMTKNINDLIISNIIKNEEFIGLDDGTFREMTLVGDKLWYIENGCITTLDINTKQIKRLKELEGAIDKVYNPGDSIYYTGENIWFYNYAYLSSSDMFYGLARYNFNEDKFYEYNGQDFYGINIEGIYETTNKAWISTYSFKTSYKIYIMNLEDNTNQETKNYFENFNSVVENFEYLWFADYGEGIFQVDKKDTIVKYDESNQLYNNYISKLILNNNKVWGYWIENGNKGISVLDISTYEWSHIDFHELEDDLYYAFQHDDKGNLWIIGDKTIINLNGTLNREKWDIYSWDDEEDKTFQSIQSVEEFKNFVLIGGDEGLTVVDMKDKDTKKMFEKEPVLEIIAEEDRCFISTNKGIYELRIK
ncbi:MAG: hypothetical protein FH761_11360 [Firmicutes bacterium]|nr:hypothetical protein [Bacillota bacterium]